ncbi:MAG TPA: hypothetical protein VHC48_19805, partial [Puia sp.]|nr:hypothetical protein [Puia sp.]
MKNAVTITWLLLIVCTCSNVCAQSVSGILNTYYRVTAVNTTSNTITVDDPAGLAPGQRVLILQAKGAAISSANDATYGNISTLNNAGGYEFNTICSINGNDVWLKDQFVNGYNAAGQVQLVTIPSYSSVVIAATVTASPWDPSTGKGGV